MECEFYLYYFFPLSWQTIDHFDSNQPSLPLDEKVFLQQCCGKQGTFGADLSPEVWRDLSSAEQMHALDWLDQNKVPMMMISRRL